jgi:pimeloyl-ACP methyl ester carboxylesterase
MCFTCDTTDTGVRERHFSLGDIDGVLWTRAADSTGDPLVLLGHGGSQHKKAPGVMARARRYVASCGFAAAAIDAPAHGERPKTEHDERSIAAIRAQIAAGEPAWSQVADYNAGLAAQAVPEWRATLDALQPRITAAVFGLAGQETLAAAAARITCPVEFLLQWDDELVPRASGLALFDALGSPEKTLHANPGRHGEVPRFEVDSSETFFRRHLR